MNNCQSTNLPVLQVSKETTNFINCLKLYQDLYSSVYSALEALYGDRAQEILEKEFCDKYKALEQTLSNFLVMSIYVLQL